jgi:solute carrier family 45 protein 1/2/4
MFWKSIQSTIALLGVQFTWTVELAYGTPYLVSLGLSAELTTLVWLAGPISGLLVQPMIGYWSDNCNLRLGKRRPFILIGTLLVNFSILLIAYAKWIGQVLNFSNGTENNIPIVAAVMGFYLLDFSINTVQASCRNLIVDVISCEHQNLANAWAARMIGVGNVLGYFIG